MSQSKDTLNIAATNYWGRLAPHQQSTSLADTLLGNAFQPLVDLSSSGGITAGAAEGWTSNSDGTEFLFTLRADLRFSDGSEVRSTDFIRSWLASVTSKDIDSEKPNTLDVLYKVEGFNIEAAKAGNVSGLTAPDERTLKIKFTKPFRTALFELTGTRYAAWKKNKDGKIIGSGPYQIVEEIPGKLVRYLPNPYFKNTPTYGEVRVVGFEAPWEEMKKGTWPVLFGKIPDEYIGNDFEYLGNSIAAHFVMDVNGTPNSLFSDPRLRLALQYAIHKPVLKLIQSKHPLLKLEFDPQFFPRLWAGRLDENETNSLIESGREYLPLLISTTKKSPLRFVHTEGLPEFIEQALIELGVEIMNPGKTVSPKTLIETVYSKHEFDITFGGASVVGNDPDGIYHLLGKNGAITSKEIFRPLTAGLLDVGRTLSQTQDLNGHYQKVNRAILKEVPMVHIKFSPPFAFINTHLARRAKTSSSSDRFMFDRILN